jgi:hypothetical protein
VKLGLTPPSLFVALPRITAQMRSPSASASSSRFSTTTPTPLPKTVPSAEASNARTRPSGERIPDSVYR